MRFLASCSASSFRDLNVRRVDLERIGRSARVVATRYDKLAVNFLSAVALAAIIAFWI
jgi:hypothetical protein